jgi:putative toxin-antitoxin system antitoxin component (TIGR02293 family)
MSNTISQSVVLESFPEYHKTIANDYVLVSVATEGIPAEVFKRVADLPGLDPEHLAALLDVSVKTVQRHMKEEKKLSPTQSEHLLKIIHLFRQGEEVFGSLPAFERWLSKPAYGLAGKTPLELLQTIVGIELIEEELTRIAYGDLA